MGKLQLFKSVGIGTMVFLAGKSAEYLDIADDGILDISQIPNGFHLVLSMPREARIVIAQKDMSQDKGSYHRFSLSQLDESENATWAMKDPIQVMRAGKNVWTSWHKINPNRVDCWTLQKNGEISLFQIGIITHDNGNTFRLLGEFRWKGKLFLAPSGKIVGRPDDPKWGNFDVRRSVLEDPEFKKLLSNTRLQPWRGKPEELDPPLGLPRLGYALIQWYVPFGGQTGQGIVVLHDGSSAWVHGIDILDEPDADGIKRLQRGDTVRYEGTQEKWGKGEGLSKLLCVSKV